MSPNDPMRYWNAWTNNYSAVDDGYITHAFDVDEYEKARRDGGEVPRTLCGVRWADSGWVDMTETEPGCSKCRKKLRKLGVPIGE